MKVRQTVKVLWAAPCSAVGLMFAAALLLFGGRVKFFAGTLEVTFRQNKSLCGRGARWLPFRAITFGHVIVAVTQQELEHLRAHERAHVEQYERWGVMFFLAYAASSIWQILMGRRAYWDNYFEVEARKCAARSGARHLHSEG